MGFPRGPETLLPCRETLNASPATSNSTLHYECSATLIVPSFIFKRSDRWIQRHTPRGGNNGQVLSNFNTTIERYQCGHVY